MAKATTSERARRLIALMGHLTPDAVFQVDDLAAAIGATPAELAADLEALSMCGTDEMDPYSMVPIMIEDGTLEVFGEMPALSGPVRLAASEATALAAALQAAGFTAGDPLVDKVLSAASAGFDAGELERTLRAATATHGHSTFTTLADAIDNAHVVEIEYATGGAGPASTRRIEPATLFAERGAWYATAWCRRSDAWRTFRIDRIRDAHDTKEPFRREARPAPDGSPVAFDATDLPVAELHFSALEPFVEREWPGARLVSVAEDGSTVVEVPYAGTAWIARRVVARLGRVEAVAPAEVRAAVVALAREALAEL